jgi:hypothetical protein
MRILERLKARVALALREAKFVMDQIRMGVSADAAIEDSVKRAFGK